MTSSRLEGESFFQLDVVFFNQQINHVIEPIIPQFVRLLRSDILFNFLFLTIGLIELVSLLFFFPFLMQSSLMAIGLALCFLTLFSYYILRVYFRTKRPEQMHYLVNRYINACQVLLNYQQGVPEHHLALATACLKLAQLLEGKENTLYPIPRWSGFFAKQLEQISSWCHWQDVFAIREMLLQRSVHEHIELVKCEPTGMEAHTALANAYVMLSSLYVHEEKGDDHAADDFWLPPKFRTAIMEKKFRQTAERAIEEFKIIGDYAPNDPWVHSQLAYSYRDLKMPEQEIKEYEMLLRIDPDDKDAMYKLGVLYFQQGRDADGLQIYEKIKRTHLKKAENLIKHYGTNLKRSNYTNSWCRNTP